MTSQPREFTGRHMLAIMFGFFGIIIAVNVTMAWLAGASWTGFVVRNSYVASQEFNEKVAAAREQRALGWVATLAIADGVAELSLTDGAGVPIALDAARLVLRSPATDRADQSVDLRAGERAYRGEVVLNDGVWVVEIIASARDGREWRDTRRLLLRGGQSR